MNEKEIREIRRRYRADKNHISQVCGCFVNENREIVSVFKESLPIMPPEEAEYFLTLLKKSLSGGLGKNLVDLEFSARQVMEGEEHKLLSLLRNSALKDEDLLLTFYQRVVENLKIEGKYLILLSYDVYDVPYRSKDGEKQMDASDEEYRYILCSICPVKLTPRQLSYHAGDNHFHSMAQYLVVSAPELGFLFPAFDDRATNLYGALYYMRDLSNAHEEFVDAIFRTEPPMPAAAQKESFRQILEETLLEDCDLELVQGIHEQFGVMIEQHKENKVEEPLLLSGHDMGLLLKECGASESHVKAFENSFEAEFGEDSLIPPMNMLDNKQFVIKMEDALIKLSPEKSELVEMRVIDGCRYLLIPVEEPVEVNGVKVK